MVVLSGRESLFVCLFISVVSLEIQLPEGSVVIPLAGLTPPHFCVSPKLGPGFPTPCALW